MSFCCAACHSLDEQPNPCLSWMVRTVSLLLQASAFVMFPDVMSACKAAGVLRSETAVDAVEIFDRKSLK